MGVFESIFNVSYLALVIALGVRLFLEKDKGARLFAFMAVILGLRDAFHLIPRVMAHLSVNGFEKHAGIMSWGVMITSITMTIFYILYYKYLEQVTGKKNHNKKILIYLLAVVRIVLVFLPQNNWGTAEGNYTMAIIRNVPFAIMGLLLIIWTYQDRQRSELKNIDVLIGLSFLFYLPVVLFSDKHPAVGAFMMPKTLAYFLIVFKGYKTYVKGFDAKNVLGLAFSFLVMGLGIDSFYLEFTKFKGFSGITHLAKVHPHTLVLGFVTLLIIYMLINNNKYEDLENIQKSLYMYITGLTFSIVNKFLIGIYEVVDPTATVVNRAIFDGLSGIGHIIIGVGMVGLFFNLYNSRQLTA